MTHTGSMTSGDQTVAFEGAEERTGATGHVSPFATLRPLSAGGTATITGGLLGSRMHVNRTAGLPHGLEQLELGGNLHNLRVAAGTAEGHHPTLTLDADVFKWVEAVAWELGRGADAGLAAALDGVVSLLLDAQQPDGYLNSWFQVVEPERRLTDLTRGCEMYCAGHLIEAGVVLSRRLGDRRLLQAACRFADLLDAAFGLQGREAIDGHEEVELALVELYRETGERRYLDLAARFIDLRGHGLVGPGVFGPRYYQDHEPVREADGVTGHAVRAMYLATGATDVYLETGDQTLLGAMERQWEAMVAAKLYLTGGLGSRERDEAIGEPYELSPDRAYCETCAAAGQIFWNWKLLQATGNPRYADLLERTLYNAFLVGVGLDGRSYFYANPLEVRAEHEPPHESEWSGETPWYISPAPEQATAHRRPWFRCACCPPNVMRVLSSLEQYVATVTADGVQVHQYAAGTLATGHGAERTALRVATEYPWHGTVVVTVDATPDREWELSLRIPAWAAGARVTVAGRTEPAAVGTWSARRRWSPGDEVVLELPLEPRLTAPVGRASATYGCVAVERGPLVYCAESPDNPDVNLADLRVDPAVPPVGSPGPTLVDGLVAVDLAATTAPAGEQWPYPRRQPREPASVDATRRVATIPYFAWANRGTSAMRVWLPSR